MVETALRTITGRPIMLSAAENGWPSVDGVRVGAISLSEHHGQPVLVLVVGSHSYGVLLDEVAWLLRPQPRELEVAY